LKKLFKWIFRTVLFFSLAGLLTLLVTYLVIAPDLPDVETLRDVRLQVPLRVYTEDGRLISVFGEKRRTPASLSEMPENLRNAFISGEDARFYEHPGVDYQGITRAVLTLATTGEKTVGGSTITQQLARNFFLTSEKTFTRKIKEIFLAFRIERKLEKDEILELYLNKIFLGYRAYGVGAAAEVYYGKPLDRLTLAQCAMIAALPKAPSRINPIKQPERALERRDYVLNRMLELGYIDEQAFLQASREEDRAIYHGAIAEIPAPYLAEMVRVAAIRQLGSDAYSGGYKVYTTINSTMQNGANEAVARGLEEYDHRHGYRGAEAHVDLGPDSSTETWNEILAPYRTNSGLVPGLVTETDDDVAIVYLPIGETIALKLEQMTWARRFISRNRHGNEPEKVQDILKPGDIIRARRGSDGLWLLGQIPETEASLVSLSPQDGAIKALVGGYDFTRSKFNRVIQSRRQPGSSFKPFLYSAALEKGFTTASLVNDAPIVFEDQELERTWKPQNFSEKFFGPTRLREAIVNSRNLVSIRLLRDIGIPYAREYITRFGLDETDLPENLSMALGSASLPPLSMARGYAVFANGGYLVEPYFISRIVDSKDRVIYRSNPATVCENCTEDDDQPEEVEVVQPRSEPVFRPLAIDNAEGELDVLMPESAARQLQTQKPIYARRVISAQNTYLIRSMMMDVVRRGTGKRAMSLGRNDLAGKTGTTNEQRDAWFNGYNSSLVTTVWVGFDNHDPLGRNEVGGRAALPIWIQYMAVALADVPDEVPEMPEGLTQARIDPETGLLARLDNPDAIMEVFEAGRLPPMEDAAEGVDSHAPAEEDPYDIY
jgi:penicillin-binding protein 1A